MKPVKMEALDMVRRGQFCALATDGAGRPHVSLMSYLPGPGGRSVIMATPAATRKFAHIEANQWVSLLFDDRETAGDSGKAAVQSLTLAGRARVIPEGPERDKALRDLGERHPQLAQLLADPGVRVVEVTFTEGRWLTGVNQVHHLKFPESAPA